MNNNLYAKEKTIETLMLENAHETLGAVGCLLEHVRKTRLEGAWLKNINNMASVLIYQSKKFPDFNSNYFVLINVII